MSEKLAIHGGSKVKTTPFGTGKRFGFEEVTELVEALNQNTLFYHHGNKVKQFLNDFNELYGVKYSVAASSGTAAIHVALGAAGVTAGDEVITSPITDQGTVIGILYQNAIPVFADLDPNTYNMDPKSIESLITPRTKAILAVHLAGNPCDMDAIMDIARRHNLKVIEDCAQSYLTKYKGRLAGTIGDYGCFSTNDFKHMSTGDGGIVTVNSGDEADFHRTHAFADKNYQRFGDSVVRDLHYLAPNYRMTELQGAVGIAQLKKLPWICEQRHVYGERVTEGIKDLPGIEAHKVEEGNWSSYWFYMFRVNESELTCTRDEFAAALNAEGVPCSAGYIPEPVYAKPLFQNKQAYIGSNYPFELSDVDYSDGICPNAEEILKTAVRMSINEFFTEQDIEGSYSSDSQSISALQQVCSERLRSWNRVIIDTHNHPDWYGHDVEKFLQNMEQCNIDKTWLLTWESPIDEYDPSYNSILPPPDGSGPISFQRCLDYVLQYPDKFILGYAPDPRRPDAIDRLNSAIDLYGVQVYGELKLRMMYDNPDALRMFRFCGEKGLPVVVHIDYEFDTGNKYPRPNWWYGGGIDAFERAVKACPETTFLGHAPGFWAHISGDDQYNKEPYPKGKVLPGGKVIEMLHKYPNLYCDISAGSGRNAFERDLDFAREFFIEFQDRIVYARDYFDNKHQELLNSLGLPETVLNKIYSENAIKLLAAK